MKKLKYDIVEITCVNSKYLPSWLTDDECCECNFECKLKIYEVESGYDYIVSKREYEKLVKNKQIRRL